MIKYLVGISLALLLLSTAAQPASTLVVRAEPIVSFTELHTTRGVWVNVTAQEAHTVTIHIAPGAALIPTEVQADGATCDGLVCTATVDADHAASIHVFATQTQSCVPIVSPVYVTEAGVLVGRDVAVYDANFFDASCAAASQSWTAMVLRP